ncbi:hypothetical protein M0R04_08810 [Candidatus Dojkabacteria bacterium]|jgi:hypothetical protein|nr:hypothetical protein [Candidatus Dojkabacteria bacterium]
MPKTKDINWICNECGKEKYNRHVGVATWHIGKCDVCKKEKAVTEPRDFYQEFVI